MAETTPTLALLTGKIAPFRGPAETSAIAKLPEPGPVAITPLGFAGDEQADPIHHGGADKAIHHYPFDHYPHWRALLGDIPLLATPGAFGENIATTGLTEENVCLGDQFRLGTALLEVSHGRQPCWKLGHRLGRPDLAAQVVETRYSGWYYRVLEPGVATAGDQLELLDRQRPQWPVARLFGVLIAGGHKREPTLLSELAAEELLAEAWRWRARELLGE
jgi:MOSC domain-containing protein YiiM